MSGRIVRAWLALLPLAWLASCDRGAPAWWSEGQDPGRVNTAGWEDSPFLSHDGRRLYFMYSPYNFWPIFTGGSPVKVGPARPGHHEPPCGSPWMDADTYVVERRDDGTWGTPENLGFNAGFTDSCGMMTRDGRRFCYLTRTVGGPENPTIHGVERNDDGTWGLPRDIGVGLAEPQHGHPCTNPHLSADERALWFASKRDGGRGGLDLWVARRHPDGTWGEPENLGPEINTREDEDQPWVSADGRLMFFNRGMAIYESTLVDGRWQPPRRVVIADTPMAAEVSLTDDLQTMCLAVPDLARKDITIAISRRLTDGTWAKPVPVD